MPSFIQRSFAGGEIAPALYARADQVKYATGLRTCLNFIVMRHGGVQNRPGFEYIATGKTLGRRVRLLKFVFNSDQTYVLEFGHLYIRIIRNGVQVAVSGVAAYSGATAYVVGDLVSSGGVNYYCIAATTGNAPPNATYWYALTGSIYEIPTPYDEADLADLQYVQSGDVVTITHQDYAPRELSRTAHTTWVLSTIGFAPSISAPAGPSATPGGAGTTVWRYKVTALTSDTYYESLPTASFSCTGGDPTAAAPNTLSWSAVSGAAEYYVYREVTPGNGVYGFIGVAAATSFNDPKIVPDASSTPPIARTPFASDFPAAVSYFQQRQVFANTPLYPEKNWMSRSGDFHNLTIRSPLQADDAITFTIAGREVNEVRHLVEVDARFVVLTAGGEWEIQGDANGTVTPTEVHPRQIGWNGAAKVRPVFISNTVLFVQARGSIVRDLRYEVAADGSGGGYRGRDLSVFADHLFRGRAITAWDYQQIPESVVWAVRDDGVLLGLTYLREHDVWGWHRHTTDGKVEDLVVVPEGDQDVLYASIVRIIGGVEYRYIERQARRQVTDIAIDAKFLDSFLSYDGRNTGATTMTLSTAAGWTAQDTITVTASAGYFVAGDVGNDMVLRAGTDEVRIRVNTYTSATVVSGTPSRDVPASLRGVAVTNWGKAVDELSGLGHLEGETVSALGDGVVESGLTVAGGAITLGRPYEVIHVGLPYTCDLETLDLEVVNGQTLADKKKRINRVTVFTQASRGFKAGPDAAHLKELPVQVANYDDPSATEPEKSEVVLNATWNNNGRVLIRQDDPLPLTVLAVVPAGFVEG